MAEREAVIVGGARTAIGKFGGAFKDTGVVKLGVAAATEAMRRAGVAAELVDDVVIGHARQAGTGPNAARQVSIHAGLPLTTPALGLQQACVSGMHAIIIAAQRVLLGEAEVVLAGGMEHMSSIPFLAVDQRWGQRMGDARLLDAMYKDGYICALANKHMGVLTDALAARYGISREAQDEYALCSQQRAQAALEAVFTRPLIVPVEVAVARGATLSVEADEHPRADTSLEKLAKLKPAFSAEGTITAGNASGITDGAAAAIVTSRERATAEGWPVLASLDAWAFTALAPEEFGVAPVTASRKAADRLGLTMKDIDLVEINEAFAAQVLAVMSELELEHDKVNVNGGAIALGHPTGMSGCRIVLQLIELLRQRGGGRGLATICGNGGHGGSIILSV